MNGQRDPAAWVLVAVVAALLLMRTEGCPVIGSPPPFKTDKLAVLIVEETDQRTPALESIYSTIENATKTAGGTSRKLDKDQTNLSLDEQWVQDAWKVKGPSAPWIVAATPRAGINQAMPTTNAADAVKLLAPLGVK